MGFCKKIFKRKKAKQPALFEGILMRDNFGNPVSLAPPKESSIVELEILDTVIVYDSNIGKIVNKSHIDIDGLIKRVRGAQNDATGKQVLEYETAYIKAIILDDIILPILQTLVR